MPSLKRKRELRALIYKDCATAIMTEVFDGILDRLERGYGALPTPAEVEWIRSEIGNIADEFNQRGFREEYPVAHARAERLKLKKLLSQAAQPKPRAERRHESEPFP